MYEKIECCPTCKGREFENFNICIDHLVTGESFALMKCASCELVITSPRPDVTNLPRYYESPDYISHTDQGNNLINFVYRIVRNIALRKKHKILTQFTDSKKILDFGCGTGEFLSYLAMKGYDTSGYEPSNHASDKINNDKIKLLRDLEERTEKFDIITLWHVLEHVADPKATLRILRKKLNKKGFIFIAVPNWHSHDAQHYGNEWAAYDVPRHLYHFNTGSMKTLLEKSKLKLIKTLPMPFDAYYVSMLSEKQKKKSWHFVKGLRSGYRSNREAKKTGQYSSLLFVAQK